MPFVSSRKVATLILCAAGSLTLGCAGSGKSPASSLHKPGLDAIGMVPTFLRGQYLTLRMDFPKGDQKVVPGQFQHGELCYLKAGGFRIDCFADGSSLNYGPNDSTDLLTDHAPSTLEPASDDSTVSQTMHMYALVTLIGGSVDRLPSTLSDYLQNPGQHMSAAVDLAEQLLGDDPVQLAGFARGGNFVVTLELDDAGREKLIDALDEKSTDTAGQLQFVKETTHPNLAKLRRTPKFKALQQHRPIKLMPRARKFFTGDRDESNAVASVSPGSSRIARTEVSEEGGIAGRATDQALH